LKIHATIEPADEVDDLETIHKFGKFDRDYHKRWRMNKHDDRKWKDADDGVWKDHDDGSSSGYLHKPFGKMHEDRKFFWNDYHKRNQEESNPFLRSDVGKQDDLQFIFFMRDLLSQDRSKFHKPDSENFFPDVGSDHFFDRESDLPIFLDSRFQQNDESEIPYGFPPQFFSDQSSSDDKDRVYVTNEWPIFRGGHDVNTEDYSYDYNFTEEGRTSSLEDRGFNFSEGKSPLSLMMGTESGEVGTQETPTLPLYMNESESLENATLGISSEELGSEENATLQTSEIDLSEGSAPKTTSEIAPTEIAPTEISPSDEHTEGAPGAQPITQPLFPPRPRENNTQGVSGGQRISPPSSP
jgi:hypothetical protein